MRWTDVNDIAIELYDAHPDVDPQYVNFVDLRNWVLALEGFDDNADRCGEKKFLKVYKWRGWKRLLN